MAERNGSARRYWFGAGAALLIFAMGSVGALLLRSFSVGVEAATIKADIKTATEYNLRQDNHLSTLAKTDQDLAVIDKMLSDAVVNLRIEQRGVAEQFKAVENRLGSIEKTQTDMTRKLDKLLERP